MLGKFLSSLKKEKEKKKAFLFVKVGVHTLRPYSDKTFTFQLSQITQGNFSSLRSQNVQVLA